MNNNVNKNKLKFFILNIFDIVILNHNLNNYSIEWWPFEREKKELRLIINSTLVEKYKKNYEHISMEENNLQCL